MRTVMLMVSVCPESGFLDVPPGCGPLAGRVRLRDADYSIGESEQEDQIGESGQKVEMTFGDFGGPVSVSASPVSEVYIRIAARRGPARSTSAPVGEV